MKTRIIKTKFWDKKWVIQAPKDVRYLFSYLMTTANNNMCGIFELPDVAIMFYTALKPNELKEAKAYLQIKKKAFFYEDWIMIVNAEEHNPYNRGSKNQIAYKKEVSDIPKNVLDYFHKLVSSQDIPSLHHTPDEKTVTQPSFLAPIPKADDPASHAKYLNDIPEEDLKEFVEKFKLLNSDKIKTEAEKAFNWLKANGKAKKDYKAYLRNWLAKRNEQLEDEQKGRNTFKTNDAPKFDNNNDPDIDRWATKKNDKS